MLRPKKRSRCGLSTVDCGFVNIQIRHESEYKCVQQSRKHRSERAAGLLKGHKLRTMNETLISDPQDERGGVAVKKNKKVQNISCWVQNVISWVQNVTRLV